MDLQTRLELQGAIQQWVASFMEQNNVSPSMMEDALTKTLLHVKELAIQEFLMDIQMREMQQAQSVPETEDVKEEELYGEKDNGGQI